MHLATMNDSLHNSIISDMKSIANSFFFFFFFTSRAALLAFCNHSEARKLYVYQGLERQEFSREDSTGPIVASPTPPKSLRQKALIFMKCTNASRLSRENMGGDVVYSECSKLPICEL